MVVNRIKINPASFYSFFVRFQMLMNCYPEHEFPTKGFLFGVFFFGCQVVIVQFGFPITILSKLI